MTTNTISVKEQLVEMACAIAKLTKIVKEKDLQITFLINKVKAQAQNTIKSSQGLDYPLGIVSPSDVTTYV